MAGFCRWIYGCICRWWLGIPGYRYTDFKKKKSPVCNRIGMPGRILCGICQLHCIFYLSQNFFLFDVAGLIIGGLIAAPIAARLVGKIPMKTMYIAVGTLVILTSLTHFN